MIQKHFPTLKTQSPPRSSYTGFSMNSSLAKGRKTHEVSPSPFNHGLQEKEISVPTGCGNCRPQFCPPFCSSFSSILLLGYLFQLQEENRRFTLWHLSITCPEHATIPKNWKRLRLLDHESKCHCRGKRFLQMPAFLVLAYVGRVEHPQDFTAVE